MMCFEKTGQPFEQSAVEETLLPPLFLLPPSYPGSPWSDWDN